jgi:hypothetical protein
MTPYTPYAINHIRQNALHLPAEKIARDLGWDIATLCNRAKRHGIELLAPNPTIDKMAELTGVSVAQVTRQPRRNPHPQSRAPVITADMTLSEIRAQLPQRQGEFLDALERTLSGGRPRRWDEIAAHCEIDCRRPNITQILRRLDHHLTPTRWRVEFAGRQGGGYRLVVRE